MSSAINARRLGATYFFAVVTFVLGATFVGLEVREFAGMIAQGAAPQRSAFLSAFFTLVGCHGLHVTVGVLVLIGVLVRGFMGHFSSRNHFGAEGTILYWHFVDAVWIALYVALYAL